jgi:hypothetical protein
MIRTDYVDNAFSQRNPKGLNVLSPAKRNIDPPSVFWLRPEPRWSSLGKYLKTFGASLGNLVERQLGSAMLEI